jgi:hypothetical protein
MIFNITTTQYEFSHGKRPKGRGYWAFGFMNSPFHPRSLLKDVGEPWFAPGDILYSEALRMAKEEAKRRKTHEIIVLP